MHHARRKVYSCLLQWQSVLALVMGYVVRFPAKFGKILDTNFSFSTPIQVKTNTLTEKHGRVATRGFYDHKSRREPTCDRTVTAARAEIGELRTCMRRCIE